MEEEAVKAKSTLLLVSEWQGDHRKQAFQPKVKCHTHAATRAPTSNTDRHGHSERTAPAHNSGVRSSEVAPLRLQRGSSDGNFGYCFDSQVIVFKICLPEDALNPSAACSCCSRRKISEERSSCCSSELLTTHNVQAGPLGLDITRLTFWPCHSQAEVLKDAPC